MESFSNCGFCPEGVDILNQMFGKNASLWLLQKHTSIASDYTEPVVLSTLMSVRDADALGWNLQIKAAIGTIETIRMINYNAEYIVSVILYRDEWIGT